MDSSTLITIATSAGIGALVSSLVTLLGQFLERKARRQEILLGKAIDLAIQRIELIKQAADHSGGTATIRDHVSIAADYYRDLKHLLSKDALPAEFLKAEACSKAHHSNANTK